MSAINVMFTADSSEYELNQTLFRGTDGIDRWYYEGVDPQDATRTEKVYYDVYPEAHVSGPLTVINRNSITSPPGGPSRLYFDGSVEQENYVDEIANEAEGVYAMGGYGRGGYESEPPTKASNPTPASNAKNVDNDLANFTWETDEGDESKVYFYIGGEWVLQDTIDELIFSADGFNLTYSEVYYWRIDTYNSDTGLTTIGDTWTFYTEPNSLIMVVPPRFPDYDPGQIYGYVDSEWQWNDIEDAGDLQFAIAGGGRYKRQLIVIGHQKIYFGDL